MHLKELLENRGFLHQYTDEAVFDLFDTGGKKFYFGVDLSANSMTIGNFVALMMAMQIMLKGNTCYLIVGGATSTIGNPSGKDNERPLLSDEQLAINQAGIAQQFQTLCDNVSTATGKKLNFHIMNNKDFFSSMNTIDYLREVGRYITVNWMLSKDIVRKRVTDPDKFISYAEFSYMLIMGYDFYHLFTNHEVIMEVGGSDERDGILTGIELIHKKLGKTAYGITNKLITDSSGKKFGKSEGNAIWLSPEKNSPYVCYNYFMNASDEDLDKYLKLFTFLSLDDISLAVDQHHDQPEKRLGQSLLAYEVTSLIFGGEQAETCVLIKETLYGSSNPLKNIEGMNNKQITALNEATSGTVVSTPKIKLIELLVQSGLYESNSEAKKGIKASAVSLNENKVTDIGYTLSESDYKNGLALIRKGKKTYATVFRKK